MLRKSATRVLPQAKRNSLAGSSAPSYTEHVPDSRDKRRRSDLGLFVLALIESGLATPYELQISAGLSPGATIPALRRLVADGWASQGKRGPRGRTEHQITTAGRRHLRSSWQQLIEAGPIGDVDADLRVALLAAFVGGNRRVAAEFLRASARKKEAVLATTHQDNQQPDRPPLASWYHRLRSESADSVALAEAAGILAMSRRLRQNALKAAALNDVCAVSKGCWDLMNTRSGRLPGFKRKTPHSRVAAGRLLMGEL